jgi:hypothetical protein
MDLEARARAWLSLDRTGIRVRNRHGPFFWLAKIV